MFDLLVALALIVLNGVFSFSELAIVSSRPARLKAMADAGSRGAAVALALLENPGRFLSTVQIGITLVGIVAGAFSGATLAVQLAKILEAFGVPEGTAEPAAYGLVIALVTYLSIVVGELVPKRLALGNPEAAAATMAPLMALVSKIAAPLVILLDVSTKLIFKLIGKSTDSESAVTEEEIKTIMAEAESAGVIETGEREMIGRVLHLGDRDVRSIMTPRADVDWIDLSDDEADIRKTIMETKHSRLPVADGTVDEMIGVVQLRDLLAARVQGEALDIRAHVRKVSFILDSLDALDVLTQLRADEVPMALIVDEHGHFEGLVTPSDILDVIAGAFRSDAEDGEPDAVQREDGSWLVAGWMNAYDFAERLGLSLPEDREYETAAGVLLDVLRVLPKTGDVVETMGWRFEIVDMDRRRIDKILATRIVATEVTAAPVAEPEAA